MRKKLIEIRKKKGYTQEQMADLKIKKILNYKKDDIFLTSNVSQTN